MSGWLNKLMSLSFFDTLRHTTNYFGAVVLIQALSIISLPVYTHYFSEQDYGIVNVYLGFATSFGVLMSLNLNGAISRYYYEGGKDFKEFLGSIFVAVHLIFIAFAIFLYQFKDSICEWINLPVVVFPYFLGFAYSIVIWRFYEQIKIAKKESMGFSRAQVVLHYAKFGISVLIILGLTHYLYLGKIWGELIAGLLIAIYILWYLKNKMILSLKKAHLKYAFNFGFPLLLFILSGHLLHFFDQWMINASGVKGNEEAGLYSYAYKIGMLLFGFITAILNASAPDYFKFKKEKSTGEIKRQISFVFQFIGLASIFLLLFSEDIGFLLAAKESFTRALNIVPVIVLGYVAFGLAQLLNRNIQYEKRNYFLTGIMMISAVVNVGLNYLFIPSYGYQIAAWTTLLSYIVMVFTSFIVYRLYFYDKSMPLIILAKMLVFVILIAAAMHWFNELPIGLYLSLIIKLLAFGIVSLLLFYPLLKKLLKA